MGWTTMTNGRRTCNHQWRAEFLGDGRYWGLNVRYRLCKKCCAYQRFTVPRPRRKPDPYPPCRQVDYGKIRREVEALLRRHNYRAVPVIVVIAGDGKGGA